MVYPSRVTCYGIYSMYLVLYRTSCGYRVSSHPTIWHHEHTMMPVVIPRPCHVLCHSSTDQGQAIPGTWRKGISHRPFPNFSPIHTRLLRVSSGTPVQNNLGELLALLAFLMPEIFRSDVIETLLEFLEDAESSSSSFQVKGRSSQ